MLKVEQTLTCDICGGVINTLRQTVYHSGPMQMISRAPLGTSQWHDVCNDCFGLVQEAVCALKLAKAAE